MKLPQKYTYPDGTTSVNRPNDGAVFIEWDSNQQPRSTWQWDDFLGQWFNVSSGKPTKQNTATFVVTAGPIWSEGAVIPFDGWLKCECGSEAVGSSKHSDWCDKHTP